MSKKELTLSDFMNLMPEEAGKNGFKVQELQGMKKFQELFQNEYEAKKKELPDLEDPRSYFEDMLVKGQEKHSDYHPFLDLFQTALDVVGFAPGAGEPVDAINAILYYLRGDKVNATLSAAAMIPWTGTFATGGKITLKGKKAMEVVKKVVVKKVVKKAVKSWDEMVIAVKKIKCSTQANLSLDDIRYEQYWNQKELLVKSNCSNETLYEYLYKINPDTAIEFAKTGKCPIEIQIPKNSGVLSGDWEIDWKQVPNGGYALDSNGNAIKNIHQPQIGEIVDRYGPSNGRYTSPVIEGEPHAYSQRSLPYVEDVAQYHQYQIIGDFDDIKAHVDKCQNIDLKTKIEVYVDQYYKGDYSNIKIYEGEIATGFKVNGGGIQYELPMPVEWLEELNLIKEIH